MKKSLVDILACPIDKSFPLELYECDSEGQTVAEGVLYCTKCTRFFVITDGIPIMMPDDLRDKKQEMVFLHANSQTLPDKITKESKPWHI